METRPGSETRPRYEYRFVRLGESWLCVKRSGRASYFEIVFEREVRP